MTADELRAALLASLRGARKEIGWCSLEACALLGHNSPEARAMRRAGAALRREDVRLRGDDAVMADDLRDLGKAAPR